MTSIPEIHLHPKAGVAELVELCAQGKIPFSGENSLYSRVYELGFNTTTLFEQVREAEERIKNDKR